MHDMSASFLRNAPRGDDKRQRILEGATQVFLAYGFQRTTMDDIAKAADVSRPALYLLFKNKSDIYRALAEAFCADILARVEAASKAVASLEGRLKAALSCVLELTCTIEQSPHGAEILDMKNSLAADIMAQGRTRMGGIIRTLLEQAGGEDQVRPNAAQLSDMLLDALDGMKARGLPLEEQQIMADAYVATVVKAVRS